MFVSEGQVPQSLAGSQSTNLAVSSSMVPQHSSVQTVVPQALQTLSTQQQGLAVQQAQGTDQQ